VLRCPVIPGLNDYEEHFRKIGALAERLKRVRRVDIEPYHPLGISKALALGKVSKHADPALPGREAAAAWIEAVRAFTSVPVSTAG
jgi:pyruvate formate lyase activating enzyme